jgi:hypothetical protein
MKQVDIYDPAMCCSTGVCGPTVDPKLVQAAADLDNLKKQGVTVNRYNLSQDLDAFAGNDVVKALLAANGTNVLPVTIVNGEVRKQSDYPSYEELTTWLENGKLPVSVKRSFVKSIEVVPSSGGCCGGSGSSCC